MKEQELINWFNNYFNNCYYVTHDEHPKSIFMYYDVNYVRKQKIAQLEGKNIEKTDITGVCLFEQDWENEWILCNYNLIWCYFKNNYSDNYCKFQSFIKDRLKDHDKINILETPTYMFLINSWLFLEHPKLSILSHNVDFVQHQ